MARLPRRVAADGSAPADLRLAPCTTCMRVCTAHTQLSTQQIEPTHTPFVAAHLPSPLESPTSHYALHAGGNGGAESGNVVAMSDASSVRACASLASPISAAQTHIGILSPRSPPPASRFRRASRHFARMGAEKRRPLDHTTADAQRTVLAQERTPRPEYSHHLVLTQKGTALARSIHRYRQSTLRIDSGKGLGWGVLSLQRKIATRPRRLR